MRLIETLNYYYYDLADPRIKDWFLLDSIWYPILITLVYLVVVLKLGPDYMKRRPAYKLNNFIKFYNLFQIITNAYLVKEFASCYHFSRIFECRPLVYSTDSCALKIINAAYYGILLKNFDLIETMIFILRKKNNQVTILHVYHHISTMLIGIIFSRYYSVEPAAVIPIVNCSIHVIMYTYYFLSNFQEPIKTKVKPFKRYLTIMQMAQFVVLIVLLVSHLPEHCQISRTINYIMISNVLFNFALFFNFYKKTYIDRKRKIA